MRVVAVSKQPEAVLDVLRTKLPGCVPEAVASVDHVDGDLRSDAVVLLDLEEANASVAAARRLRDRGVGHGIVLIGTAAVGGVRGVVGLEPPFRLGDLAAALQEARRQHLLLRVVLVSKQPEAVLDVLRTKLPGCVPVAVPSVDEVGAELQPDAVILLDLGDASESVAAARRLREGGVEQGIVLIGTAAVGEVRGAVGLEPPFRLGDLAAALQRAASTAVPADGGRTEGSEASVEAGAGEPDGDDGLRGHGDVNDDSVAGTPAADDESSAEGSDDATLDEDDHAGAAVADEGDAERNDTSSVVPDEADAAAGEDAEEPADVTDDASRAELDDLPSVIAAGSEPAREADEGGIQAADDGMTWEADPAQGDDAAVEDHGAAAAEVDDVASDPASVDGAATEGDPEVALGDVDGDPGVADAVGLDGDEERDGAMSGSAARDAGGPTDDEVVDAPGGQVEAAADVADHPLGDDVADAAPDAGDPVDVDVVGESVSASVGGAAVDDAVAQDDDAAVADADELVETSAPCGNADADGVRVEIGPDAADDAFGDDAADAAAVADDPVDVDAVEESVSAPAGSAAVDDAASQDDDAVDVEAAADGLVEAASPAGDADADQVAAGTDAAQAAARDADAGAGTTDGAGLHGDEDRHTGLSGSATAEAAEGPAAEDAEAGDLDPDEQPAEAPTTPTLEGRSTDGHVDPRRAAPLEPPQPPKQPPPPRVTQPGAADPVDAAPRTSHQPVRTSQRMVVPEVARAAAAAVDTDHLGGRRPQADEASTPLRSTMDRWRRRLGGQGRAEKPTGPSESELYERLLMIFEATSKIEAITAELPIVTHRAGLYRALVETVKDEFSADTVGLWRRASNGWVASAHHGFTGREASLPVGFDQPVMDEVDRSAGALLLDPAVSFQAMISGIGGAHTESFMAASVAVGENRLGIIAVGRNEPLVESDLDRLVDLAVEAAVGIGVSEHIERMYGLAERMGGSPGADAQSLAEAHADRLEEVAAAWRAAPSAAEGTSTGAVDRKLASWAGEDVDPREVAEAADDDSEPGGMLIDLTDQAIRRR